jgi:hypothetical protein
MSLAQAARRLPAGYESINCHNAFGDDAVNHPPHQYGEVLRDCHKAEAQSQSVVCPVHLRESTARDQISSAKDQVRSQSGLASFFVLRVHVPACVGQSLDRGVKIDAVA